MKIKINKSSKTKFILLLLIVATLIGINITLLNYAYYYGLSFFSMFFSFFTEDGPNFFHSSLSLFNKAAIILYILILILLALIYIYRKKKIEYIEPKDMRENCIKCSHEMSNQSHICEECGYNNSFDCTCNNCLAINNINSSVCIKCGNIITKADKIYQVNKQITLDIVKIILFLITIVILSLSIFGVVLAIFIIYHYYKKIKELFNILNVLKSKNE